MRKIFFVGPTFMVGLRILIVVISLALCAEMSRAQTSPAFGACSASAKTQTALTTCADKELTRAESGLNVVYDKLLNKVSGRPDALARLRTAEKAWIAYRDAYLEAMYPANDKQAEYGSIYPMEANLVLAELTRQQTIALTNLLRKFSGQTH